MLSEAQTGKIGLLKNNAAGKAEELAKRFPENRIAGGL